MSDIKKEMVAVGGKLRLKKDGGIKKKPRNKPESTVVAEKDSVSSTGSSSTVVSTVEFTAPIKTKAEQAFSRRQLELQLDRVYKKAQMSHREKVERFNTQMNDLTEFNDIPKVSWTK